MGCEKGGRGGGEGGGGEELAVGGCWGGGDVSRIGAFEG